MLPPSKRAFETGTIPPSDGAVSGDADQISRHGTWKLIAVLAWLLRLSLLA